MNNPNMPTGGFEPPPPSASTVDIYNEKVIYQLIYMGMMSFEKKNELAPKQCPQEGSNLRL
jgi:hypothetical protein